MSPDGGPSGHDGGGSGGSGGSAGIAGGGGSGGAGGSGASAGGGGAGGTAGSAGAAGTGGDGIGIAAAYPNDQGIADDPRVIFASKFEDGSSGSEAQVILYDDVVIADQRIGCMRSQ